MQIETRRDYDVNFNPFELVGLPIGIVKIFFTFCFLYVVSVMRVCQVSTCVEIIFLALTCR